MFFMQRKKAKIVFSLFSCLILFLTSCKKNQAEIKKNIVCTTFPHYDWVMNILGEKSASFEITLLQDNGTDLHNFQPSFKDMAKVADCDLFIFVGGESDFWVNDALKNSRNANQVSVNLMECLGERVQEEELVEGMEAESEEEEEAEEEVEYDEHIWLSVKNAILLTDVLQQAISNLDKENAAVYVKNAAAYKAQLIQLDSEYTKIAENAVKHTILVGDRFPFRYLADDYNISYYAAFVGCSAETEASFKTIIFLANKVDELNLDYVFTLEKSDGKIARTIIENTSFKNQQILQLDSLQSITKDDMKTGKNYISVMKENLEVLKKGLN